jgi:hypothetical protein
MGRVVKRVPITFDWPMDAVWSGYLLPDHLDFPSCSDCAYEEGRTYRGEFRSGRSTGYSPQAWVIAGSFYPHMVGGPHADVLAWHDKITQDEVDHLLSERRLTTWVPGPDGERGTWEALPRTAAEVNAAQRRGGPISGHDAINRIILIRYRCERLGIPVACPTCAGNGDVATAAERAEQDAWERTEPPAGDGWQLWETVSEGSPISPVFADAEGLVAWMSDPDRGRDWVPPETAARFIAIGSASTGFSSQEVGFVSGVEFVGSVDTP